MKLDVNAKKAMPYLFTRSLKSSHITNNNDIADAQLGRQKRKVSLALFENQKKCPNRGKKGSDCDHIFPFKMCF